MPLDPQAKALLEEMAQGGQPPYTTLTPVEARQAMVARSIRTGGEPEPVGRVREIQIPGPGGRLPLRLYFPVGSGPFPTLMFFHGGGFVVGSLDTHDTLCRAITNAADCLVVSVDYRLAPESKFPAAAEDAFAATRWVAANAAEIDADPTFIAVGGDSAGGNLAAVTALMARDRGGPPLHYQLLLYPVVNHAFDTPSYQENGSGYMLTRDGMQWYWQSYLANEADGNHPYASPLRAEHLRNLPPALIITAGFDPLRDEGEAYVSRLRAAGVPVAHTRYEEMIHGFARMFSVLDQSRKAVEQIGGALREAYSAR